MNNKLSLFKRSFCSKKIDKEHFLWSNLKTNYKKLSLSFYLHWPLSKMLIRSVFVHVFSFTGYILPISKKMPFFNILIVTLCKLVFTGC